jgi:probable rRNA maturation factor
VTPGASRGEGPQDGPDPRIDVQVQNEFAGIVSVDFVRLVAEITLAHTRDSGPDRVTVLVADDETLLALNREYADVDEVTDVLAFSAQEGMHGCAPADGPIPDQGFVLPPAERDRLGDIAISYPQAVSQAEADNAPVERELALLVAHGVLHLLGFDHSDERAEADMSARTHRVLDEVLGL